MHETPGHPKSTVTFFFRKPRLEYHSIENLFRQVMWSLQLQRPEWTIEAAICPQSRITPQTLWRNTWFARRYRGAIKHITGDVHYIVLGCEASQTVLTIHDCVILNRNQHRPLRFMFFKLFWYYLPIRKAAVVTTISEKTRQELYQYVGRLADKVIVVPNGYDPAFTFNPQPFNTKKPTLLHIGTAPHKNLSRLVEAIEGLQCRLIIVGKLTNAEKDNLTTRRIDYLQYVNISQEQIINLYGQCDIVTFVSMYEGFGMPVLEGQVVGRPVVTSNISPMTEVGGEGACYVDPTDIDDIRRGILRVWQDETYRNELVRAGRANAQLYSIERVTARYVALYESLAAT